jgi:hypothetical protein
MWLVLLMMSGEAALYGAIGLFQLRSFYRYGHIPRVIRVDRTREALSTHREGSNRWRDWPLAAVREVQLKPLKSVIPGQKANELVIRVQGRWIPLRYRIRNQDVPVAERFVTWLNDSRL